MSDCCEGIIQQRSYRIGNISAANFVLGTLPFVTVHRPVREMGTLVQNVVMMMGTLMHRVIFVFPEMFTKLVNHDSCLVFTGKSIRNYATLPCTSIVVVYRD